jgi:hypothetical protein
MSLGPGLRLSRSTRAAPSTRCSARRASPMRRSRSSTTVLGTASRSSTSTATRRPRARTSRARWTSSGHAHLYETGVDREGGRGDPAGPAAAVRPPGAVGDHQPVRDGEHARALGVRAHARARDAARRREDAAADAADMRHESVITAVIGAARTAAWDLSGRARDDRARPVRPALRAATRPARGARDRRRHRRDPRRRSPQQVARQSWIRGEPCSTGERRAHGLAAETSL